MAEKTRTTDQRECDFCGKLFDKLDDVTVYSSPFESEGNVLHLCEECDSNLEEIFFCEECGRYIEESYGHRVNYKIIGDEMICASCYQKMTLVEGQPESDFGGKYIHGDFYNYDELAEHGFHEHENYAHASQKERMQEEALKLIGEGKKVIVNLESISIIGDDGSYSLWVKGNSEEEKKEREKLASDAQSEV